MDQDSELFGQEELPAGLIVIPGVINDADLEILETYIDSLPCNQSIVFGPIPSQFQALVKIGQSYTCRMPVFDQMIINKYRPGDFLTSHVDLDRFEDVILLCNVKGYCQFTFRHTSLDVTYDIDLKKGDVILLTGAARWDWAHGINRISVHRYSVTLRKMSLNGDGISLETCRHLEPQTEEAHCSE
jgi:hypothetical protein